MKHSAKQKFKIFWRDLRIYKNNSKTSFGDDAIQNFHINFCPQWVHSIYNNRNNQTDTDLIQNRIFTSKLFFRRETK